MGKKSARPDVAIENDKRHSGDVDGYIARNRDALNTSIRKSRVKIAEGNSSTKSIDDIILEGRVAIGKIR